MPPFVFDAEPASLLYLINLTAGLMDGDGHLVEITARAGTRAVVTGQSATRVHPAVASYATQQWTVEVEDDACLVVLPGPTIPFRGSRYYQRGRVELAPRARLIWGDIWLAGRYDRGEHVGAVPVRADRPGLRGSSRGTGWSTATASDGMAPGRPKTRTGTSAGPWPRPACSWPARCRRSSPRPSRPSDARSSGSTPARVACDGAAIRSPSRPTSCATPYAWRRAGPSGPRAPPGSSPRAASPLTTGSRRRRNNRGDDPGSPRRVVEPVSQSWNCNATRWRFSTDRPCGEAGASFMRRRMCR